MILSKARRAAVSPDPTAKNRNVYCLNCCCNLADIWHKIRSLGCSRVNSSPHIGITSNKRTCMFRMRRCVTAVTARARRMSERHVGRLSTSTWPQNQTRAKRGDPCHHIMLGVVTVAANALCINRVRDGQHRTNKNADRVDFLPTRKQLLPAPQHPAILQQSLRQQ